MSISMQQFKEFQQFQAFKQSKHYQEYQKQYLNYQKQEQAHHQQKLQESIYGDKVKDKGINQPPKHLIENQIE